MDSIPKTRNETFAFLPALGGISGGELEAEVGDGGDQAGPGLHQTAAGLGHPGELE